MNWTDNPELRRMKEILDSIENTIGINSENEESYFVSKRTYNSDCLKDIFEYNIDSPINLENELNAMWSESGKTEMCRLAKVCAVAFAKGRDSDDKQDEVSQYIYEF